MAFRKIRSTQVELSIKDAVSSVVVDIDIDFNAAPNYFLGQGVLTVGSRVLCMSQTDGTENGIYEIVSVGTGSDGVWVRASDWQVGEVIMPGTSVLVFAGIYAGKHAFSIPSSGTVVGTDDFNFEFVEYTNPDYIEKAGLETENLSSQIDGVNKVFVLSNTFYAQNTIPLGAAVTTSSIVVTLNGIDLEAGSDYGHDGVNTITLLFAPKLNPGNPDKLCVQFIAV